MNEASSHILVGLKNLVNPDVDKLIPALRSESRARAGQLRQDAPSVIAAAADWILENSEEICDVIQAGTRHLPMSRPMLMEAFNNCVNRWVDPERLRGLIREECATLNVGRPILPNVVFHNLAGNLFISGWESITHATLLGAASIVRCSDDDRVFPGIWARAIATANPEFSGLIAVCEWNSGDMGRFQSAVGNADAVVSFGSDEAVQNLRRYVPWNKPFAGHGSTLSFSIISSEELRSRPVEILAESTAYDFAAYDQQGCLSPRALFLEDRNPRDVDRFVDSLLSAARHLQTNLPRGELSLEDRAALARSRDDILIDAACGGSSRRVSGDQDPFLIAVKPVDQFKLGPVNRNFDIYLFRDLTEILRVLEPFRGHISTVGVPDPKRAAMDFLTDLDVKRVCSLGAMQIPPLAWSLDGQRPLQKLCRMQSIQTTE